MFARGIWLMLPICIEIRLGDVRGVEL